MIGEPAAGLFRREILNHGVAYNATNPYLIDLAFWADALRHGDAFVDREYLATFRISDGAVSAQIGLKQARAFRAFVRRLRLDAFYRINKLDVVLGYCLPFQWCILRNLFLKRKHGGEHKRTAGRKCGEGVCLDRKIGLVEFEKNDAGTDQCSRNVLGWLSFQVLCVTCVLVGKAPKNGDGRTIRQSG
jgi:hypothetical protein